MTNNEEDHEFWSLPPELRGQIESAIANAQPPEDDEVAIAARYDEGNDLVLIELKSGQRLALPREDLQGLESGSPADLAEVELVGLGTGLHWEKLNADHLVKGLVEGQFGNRRWMAGLAQRRRERLRRAS